MPSEKFPWPAVASDGDGSHSAEEVHSLTPLTPSGMTNTPSARREQLEGTLLAAKYRLVRQLGAGGMGSVWVANNEALGNDVAIKLIRNDLEEPILTARLMTEARAIARLGHPNVVRVFDVAQTEAGQPFIVMELLRGQSLGAKIRREGRMTPAAAVQTLLPIAHALAATHAEGIVHRDLKPDNIVLEERDDLGIRPVLVDFGIAKVKLRGSAKLTQDGSTLGSPEYMSPEQARGDEVDARADMWAFCIVLYEALLGHVPFTDTNYHRLLRRIVDEPIPTFSRVGIRDDALWGIIEKGLRKDPGDRFESMRALGVNLARWLLDMGITEDIGHGSVRATWLQASMTDARRVMGSRVDTAETLACIQSDRPPRFSLGSNLRRRYRAKRLGWFAAIFLGSILGTLLAKSWLRKSSMPNDSSSASISTLAGKRAVEMQTAGASSDAVANVANVHPSAALPLRATAENTAFVAPTTTNMAPPSERNGVPRLPATQSVRSSHGAPAAKKPAPEKLDIKTDF